MYVLSNIQNFKYANNKIEPKLQNIQKPRPTSNKSHFFEAVRSENSIHSRNKLQIGKRSHSSNENYRNRTYDEHYNGNNFADKGYINNEFSKVLNYRSIDAIR